MSLWAALAVLGTAPIASAQNRADSWRAAFEKVESDPDAAVEHALNAHEGDSLDWGFEKEKGFEAEMPWLASARQLAPLLTDRAAAAAEAGDGERAAQLLASSLYLSRDVGDSTMFAELVEAGVISLIESEAEPTLGDLKASDLSPLVAALDTCEGSVDMASAVERERDMMIQWLEQQPTFPMQVFKAIGADEPGAEMKAQFEAFWANAAKKNAMLTALRQGYNDATVALKKKQLNAKLRATAIMGQRNAQAESPYGLLGQLLLPNYEAVAAADVRGKTSFALLEAAVAQISGGDDARQKVRDPATNRPFNFEKIGEGFRLTSDMTDGAGEKMTLTVGN